MFIKKRFKLLVLFAITLFTIIQLGVITNADINFIFGKDVTINNINTNSNNVIVNSRDIRNIDDSDMLDKFTHLKGYKDISFDIYSSKDINVDEIQKTDIFSGNIAKNTFKLNNLEIETEYKEVDTSFFNIDKKPVKQTYIVKNLLNEYRNIKLNIKYEIDSSFVIWNGTEYEITKNPKYFKAFYDEYEVSPGISEPSLTGHTLYFDHNYYDFKDVVDLDYKVSVYSEKNKNYIDLEVIFDINAFKKFIIDPEIGWTAHIINNSADAAHSVYAIDIDNDNDIDVLSASRNDDKVVWYENNGGSPLSWTSHIITNSANGAEEVFAIDINADNDIDVLSVSLYDDKVVWYENDGSTPPVWTARIITTSADWATDVYAIDVDNDNDIDVLSASLLDDKVAWYENNGGSPPGWTAHIINNSADEARSIYAIDLDNDNNIDVVSASFLDDKIAWYENINGDGSSWTAHIINNSANGAQDVFAIDLDNDNDIDVLSASQYDDKVAWYENNGGSPLSWTSHIITTSADAPMEVYAIDLDNDNDIDVLSASLDGDKIAWYENNGGSPLSWTSHIITTSVDGAEDVFAIDLDADNDIDVLSASLYDDKIAWYESDLDQTCYDGIMNGNEEGVDCGGRCPFVCGYCIPRIENGPHENKLDIVFVPDESYVGNTSLFLDHVDDIIENAFNGTSINNGSTIVRDNIDKFNFYYIEDEGSVDTENFVHILPSGFYSECSFYDTAMVVHTDVFRDFARGNIFSSENYNYGTIMHETGHSLFGLADEYGNDSHYFEPAPFPNIWESNQTCREDDIGGSWSPDDCYEFCPAGAGKCGFGWWRSDPDPDIMEDDGDETLNPFERADLRNINWTFNQYPNQQLLSEDSDNNKVAIISLLFSNDEVDLTELKIIYSDSPEHISQNGDMNITLIDEGNTTLDSFLFWDPRIVITENESVLLDESNTTIITPLSFNESLIRFYNGSNNLKLQIDMNQYINNFCTFADGRCDPDCSLSIDPDCKLDVQDFKVISEDSRERVFEFLIKNNDPNGTLYNINWSLYTGENNISAQYLTELVSNNTLFVLINYNYSAPGNYTLSAWVNATNALPDVESLNIEVI